MNILSVNVFPCLHLVVMTSLVVPSILRVSVTVHEEILEIGLEKVLRFTLLLIFLYTTISHIV